MIFSTTDLCDRYAGSEHLQIAEPVFRHFGAKTACQGQVVTIKTFEDTVLIRRVLEEKGEGRVLVVDGGGSHRCALVDRELAELACANGWAGLILYGCVRHSVALHSLPITIRALHAHPLQGHQRGSGDRNILITVAGVNFRNGYYVYADEDGIVVSDREL
ncbi:MAG: hypothetical protein RLZZ226_2263 [Pseudomonadota bacterium]|jgi:regulator of ribonuclease activity A